MPKARPALLALAIALATLRGVRARAADQLLPGLKLVMKDVGGRQRLVFVSRAAVAVPAPGDPDDPRSVGATVDVVNPLSSEAAQFALPASNWRVNTSGTVYKFVNRVAPAPPSEVKVAVLKRGRLVKIVAKATGITLDEPSQGRIGIVLAAGTTRWCAVFDQTIARDEPGRFIARNAPAPAACPVPAPSTTTSTSTTGTPTTTIPTTTTTTTTTTLPPACDCCSFGQLSFTTGIDTGNCGTVLDSAGTPILNLACGGLYFGGGLDSVPLPARVPDMAQSITSVIGCGSATGAFTLGPTSAAETGSLRNCTQAGCLFGPPLPIPNSNSTPQSACVISALATDTSGSGNCNGIMNMNLPLASTIYLTGDLLPTEPGIQPCPLCTGPSGDETCRGGPNDGSSCTPASSPLGDAYPTSHDCPPDTTLFIGTLPIGLALTTQALEKTAVASGTKPRVFCGYCRDADGSEGFGVCIGGLASGFSCRFSSDCPGGTCGNEVPCTSDAQCSQPREACEQANNGAFGESTAKTIVETGSPADVCLNDGQPHAARLVSVFCIPPSFYSTVDIAADLPGPGALALTGALELLP